MGGFLQITLFLRRLTTLSALVLLLIFARIAKVEGAVSFNEVEFWAGSGTNMAGMVVDWQDGLQPLYWGYKWDDPATPTGQDMLQAITTADGNLDLDYISYVRGIAYTRESGANSSESYDFGETFTGEYWSYHVNASQTPDDYTSSTHGTPNGDPYGGGGVLFSSNTGASDRPLSNGSWDVWLWLVPGSDTTPLNEPIPAPIPEPRSFLLLLLGVVYLTRRRIFKIF